MAVRPVAHVRISLTRTWQKHRQKGTADFQNNRIRKNNGATMLLHRIPLWGTAQAAKACVTNLNMSVSESECRLHSHHRPKYYISSYINLNFSSNWNSTSSKMVRYFTSLPSSKLSSSPPRAQKTNTITVTGLPKSFFHPIVLDVLRCHFAAYGEINRWVPLPGFGRIMIVFQLEDSAESAKQHCDPIVFEGPLDK